MHDAHQETREDLPPDAETASCAVFPENASAHRQPVPEAGSSRLIPFQGAPALARKAPAPGSLKILVVEDDFTSRVVLQRLLSKYGEIDVAVDGFEAIEAFEHARREAVRYDLICMDIRLPKIDGTEAVRQIRSIEDADHTPFGSKVKIFMTTALRDLKTVSSAYKALCDTYLFKPIDGAQLHDHMRAFGLIDPIPVARVR